MSEKNRNLFPILISIILFASVLIPRIPHLLGDTLLIISILFVLLLQFFKKTWDDDYHTKSTTVDLPILLLVFLVIVSLVRSLNFHDSLRETLKVISYIILFFVIVQYKDKEKMAKIIIRTVLITGFFVAVYGIYEHITIVKSFWYPRQMVYSTFPNPNHFGGYLVVSIVLSLGLLLFNSLKRKERIFLTVVLITSFVGLYSSNSKGALLSLAASLFALAAVKGRKYFKIYMGLVISLSLIVIFLISPVGRQVTPQGFMSDPYMYGRIPLWGETLRYISDYPFLGTGIATFKDYYPQYKSMAGMRSAEFAHNEFLNISAELGLFTLIVVVWLLVILFKRMLILVKSNKQSEAPVLSKGLSVGILAAIIAILAQSLVEFNMHTPGIAVVFLSLTGIVISFSSSGGQKSSNPFKKSKKIIVSIIVVTGFVLLLVLLVMPLIADHHAREGHLYQHKKDYLRAIKEYEKAIKFNPLFTPYRERLGDLYLIEGKILEDENFIFGAYYEYNKCVKMYPRNVFYRLKLARFYKKHGALDKALEQYQHIIELAPNVEAFQQEYEGLRKEVE